MDAGSVEWLTVSRMGPTFDLREKQEERERKFGPNTGPERKKA